jgi:hypothetical protein
MVNGYACISAALGMNAKDVYSERRRLWVRLREKGGKRHEMPCYHNLEAYWIAYIAGTGVADGSQGPLFRTLGRKTKQLTRPPAPRQCLRRYPAPRRRGWHCHPGRQS